VGKKKGPIQNRGLWYTVLVPEVKCHDTEGRPGDATQGTRGPQTFCNRDGHEAKKGRLSKKDARCVVTRNQGAIHGRSQQVRISTILKKRKVPIRQRSAMGERKGWLIKMPGHLYDGGKC